MQAKVLRRNKRRQGSPAVSSLSVKKRALGKKGRDEMDEESESAFDGEEGEEADVDDMEDIDNGRDEDEDDEDEDEDEENNAITFPEETIVSSPEDEEDIDEVEDSGNAISTSGRHKKIPIKYIQNKTRRHVTFAKRRHGIMKKAYELSVLTGANILLLILSNSNGLVYTFSTPKLEPLIEQDEGKALITRCLNDDT